MTAKRNCLSAAAAGAGGGGGQGRGEAVNSSRLAISAANLGGRTARKKAKAFMIQKRS